MYTKHKIIRCRDINSEYFEVLFAGGKRKFKVGDGIMLLGDSSRNIAYISSGISECWVRLILKKSIFSSIIAAGSEHIKILTEVNSELCCLMDEESPNFYITSEGIGPVLSYCSTYPRVKCKICYIGDELIHEDWFRTYHELVNLETIQKCSNLYIIGVGLEDIECKVRVDLD
jgi:hypothetical protein